MSRLINMKCPKCGGMYMKAGRCETCGFIIDEAMANQNVSKPKHETTEHSNLMPCPDCGRMISKDAHSCPQCGCPFPGNEKRESPPKVVVQKKSGSGVLGTIIAIVIAGLTLWYIAAPYTTPVWLQKIGGTIRCFFTGETSYTIFDLTKKP